MRNSILSVFRRRGVRDILNISLGTLVGRLITFAALPVVTRLYSPEEYALLAVFLAMVTIASVAACLRFDVAVPLARDDADALYLLLIGLASAFFVALALSFLVLGFSKDFAFVLGQPSMAGFLWLVPIGVLMVSSYSVFQNWATRARSFSAIAKTRAAQSVVGVLVVLGLGFLGVKPLGLLLGNVLAIGSGFFSLGILAFLSLRVKSHGLSFAGVRAVFYRYKDYPRYSVPDSLANVVGLQFSVILIGKFLGAEAGFLMLAMQLMSAPVALLGGSVAQVYISRASERQRRAELAVFTLEVLRKLVRVGWRPSLCWELWRRF